MQISTLVGRIDDRGKAIPGRIVARGTPSDLTENEHADLKQWKRDHRWARWRLHIVNLLATGLLVGYIGLLFSGFTFPGVLRWVALAAFMAGTVGVPVWLIRRDWGNRRASLLFLERCPYCALDLSRLPVASDGCTTCRECGYAWQIDGR